MKSIKFYLDREWTAMSRRQATEIEKEFGVHLDFNIDTQLWELIVFK